MIRPLTSLRLATLLAACLPWAAAPVSAEVVSRTVDGFVLRYEVRVETTPDDAYHALGEVGRWWNGAHTYSGSGANLTLPLAVGACLCEALADGTLFEHGRVTALDPATGAQLDAPLGPLKGKANRAQLSIAWVPAVRGLSLVMTYEVQGAGLGALAGPVDGVMGDQFARYARYVEYGESPDEP